MERCECLPLNSKFARKSVLVKTKPSNRQTVISSNHLFKVLSTGTNRTHALSLGRHSLMALSMVLCLNSAQTEINRCCFCKAVWRRYLGEVGKFHRTLWLIYPRLCIPISIKIGGEVTLRNAEYGMRNSTTYTLRNYRCGMFGYLLAVRNYCKCSHALIQ